MSIGSPPDLPPLVARLRAAGCVFAELEAQLLLDSATTTSDGVDVVRLADLADRRTSGEPLEHVLGWAEFAGLRIAVAPGVFVPRLRTEYLFQQALAVVERTARHRPIVVVDLCCGTGAVGAALLATLERVLVHAVDIDPGAVACARVNLGPRGGRVYQGDLFEPLPSALQGLVDVVVANPPYVPSEELIMLPREARVHEPTLALDGGPDGLDGVRRIAAEAERWLAPHGAVVIEMGERQAAQGVQALRRGGLDATVTACAERGATVLLGRRPPTGLSGCVDGRSI